MFFKKKYHTLKIKNSQYKTLSKSIVFTAYEVEKLKEALEVFQFNDNWSFQLVIDKKDSLLSAQEALEIYHLMGLFKEIEELPVSITTLTELEGYLREKGEKNE